MTRLRSLVQGITDIIELIAALLWLYLVVLVIPHIKKLLDFVSTMHAGW